MSNPAVATLFATTLRDNPIHPGDGKSGPIPIPMPWFRSSGIPSDQAEAFAKEAGVPSMDIAQLAGEVLVHALDNDAKTVIDNAELEALRAAASDREHLRNRQVEVSCHCGAKLFKANVTDFDTDKAKISPQVIKALRVLSPECALAHQPVGA